MILAIVEDDGYEVSVIEIVLPFRVQTTFLFRPNAVDSMFMDCALHD